MRILLAGDEDQLSRAVAAVLRHMNYEVDIAQNGQIAVRLASQNTYDCMVLDIMMPVMDGIEALKKIRAGGDVTPVIMLTAKSEVSDRVAGLDAGADDYLSKPFAIAELAARIRSQARRQGSYTPRVLSLGNVKLDTSDSELKAVNSIRLSQKEADLMEFLMLNEGKNLTTSQILDKVWKEGTEKEEVVWMYISYLRGKLDAVSADLVITGEKGGPYRLKEQEWKES